MCAVQSSSWTSLQRRPKTAGARSKQEKSAAWASGSRRLSRLRTHRQDLPAQRLSSSIVCDRSNALAKRRCDARDFSPGVASTKCSRRTHTRRGRPHTLQLSARPQCSSAPPRTFPKCWLAPLGARPRAVPVPSFPVPGTSMPPRRSCPVTRRRWWASSCRNRCAPALAAGLSGCRKADEHSLAVDLCARPEAAAGWLRGRGLHGQVEVHPPGQTCGKGLRRLPSPQVRVQFLIE